MTERITAMMVGNSTIATIDSDLNNLDRTQTELSTGYQINEPSDDPFGAAETLSLQSQVADYTTYGANVNDGTAWIGSASSSLQSIQEIAQSVRTLLVEAANGTLSQSNLSDAAATVTQYVGSVKQAADAEVNGQYVFSGTATNTLPYQQDAGASDLYQGQTTVAAKNTSGINRLVAPATTIPVNANLYSILGDGSNSFSSSIDPTDTASATGDGGLLATMRQIATDMQNGDQKALSSDISTLDGNLDSLESLQARVGATQDQLQLASTRMTAFQTTASIQLGNVYDVDMAKATVDFSTEQAGYQAALQSSADIIQTSLLNFLQS